MRLDMLDYIEGGAMGFACGAGILSGLGVIGPWWALAGIVVLAAVVGGEMWVATGEDSHE